MGAAALRAAAVVLITGLVFLTGFRVAPATAEETVVRPGAAAARVVARGSFDRGVAGWSGKRSRLTTVRDGVRGSGVRVSPTGTKRPKGSAKGRSWLYAAPRPVRVTAAGTVYRVSAWVRGTPHSKAPICLRLREVVRGNVIHSAKHCAAARSSWRRVASVSLRAKKPGSQIGVMLDRIARFDVDELRVSEVRQQRSCRRNCTPPPPTTTTAPAPPPPPPPTTTTTTTTTAPPPPPPPPPTTTTTTTTTTPPPPPPPPAPVNARVVSFENGDFTGFDATNAAPASGVADPTTLRVLTGLAYDGIYAGKAHIAANALGANKYSRGIFQNLTWSAGSDVWYGCAFYMPAGFYASQQGQIDLMRWDNWVDDPSTTDRGGIVVYGPPASGQAFLMRGRIGSPQDELVGPFTISEGRWHWIEVHQRFSPGHTNDLSEVYLNGALVGRSTAKNWNDRRIMSIRYGLVALADDRQSQGLDLWFDRPSISTSRLGPLG